jgi:hypothetical protein
MASSPTSARHESSPGAASRSSGLRAASYFTDSKVIPGL